MTKTELRKLQTKTIMEMLINKYNAYNIEDSEGGRILFYIDTNSDVTLQCEYHRTYQNIAIFENVRLSGNNWSDYMYAKVRLARIYEEMLNKEVKNIITQDLAV